MLETLSTVVVPEPINRPDERFIVGSAPARSFPALEKSRLETT